MTTDLVRKEENTVRKFFSNIFGELEIFEENGVIYFPAKKVATILGYSDPSRAIKHRCTNKIEEDWGQISPPMISVQIPDNLGRIRDTKFIDFNNLMKLVMSSKLPNVIQFQNWIIYKDS